MAEFEVQSYTVSVGSRANDSTERALVLDSIVYTHAIRHKASLVFETVPPGIKDLGGVGYVTNVGALNYNGHTIGGWLNPGLFDEVYDVVRNEKPIKLRYSYKDWPDAETSTTKLLTRIVVSTDDEIPGEGGDDSDSTSSEAMISAVLADVATARTA
jgi:hypothetical protein